MDATVFKTLQAVAAEEDAVKRAQLQRESDTDLAAHFGSVTNRGDLEELAYDVFASAWADAMAEDIVPKIIEVKTVGLGEIDYIDDDLRGLKAYWQGKGGQILSDIIRYERTQMPREEMVSAIDLHQDELRTKFWGTLDQLSTQAREKLSILPVERLIELVQVAIASGTYYGTYTASTLTDAQVDAVLDEVAARSNGEVAIVGTRIALRYLAKVGLTYGDNIAEQVFRTGQIGVYKGYPVVQVENFENFAGDYVLPNNELWFVGRKAGRLTYYGDQPKVQTLNLPSFYLRWETARDAGMLLYGAERGRIGRVVLT